MIKKIYGITLMMVFIVVGMSIANAATPAGIADVSHKVEKYAHQHTADAPQAKSILSATRAKSEAGMDKMCLGIDLQKVKRTIEGAINDTESEIYAVESIDLLVYHLEGTAEAEKLSNLLHNDTATMFDYMNTVNEVEQSLRKRLKGEELWAFKVGSNVFETVYLTHFGTKAEVKTALTKLRILADEAPKYVLAEEVKLLQTVTNYANSNSLTDKDYMDIEMNVLYFLEIYFGA